ncbi:mechanosensitive ion channel [Alphaproteobacteria bacterium KMM 3653]|uniref:Small-conductance mechanosensitive channel n=1 Tax=Harenicola maris TaxID=2841044 RepID=A0AAP2G4U5_9RHOB|nr:mechanosensitive ion channel [Harenicola maris]
MRFIHFALLFLCLPLTLSPLPAAAQDDQPSGSIAVEDTQQTDAAIANRLREILGELEGYEDITVTVSSGIVTLRGTTLDTPAVERLNAIAGRVQGVVAIENEVTESTDVVQRLNPLKERFLNRFWQAVAFTPLLLIALTVFTLVVLLGFFVARPYKFWTRIAPNAFIADIYRMVVRLVFIVAALVLALDILSATALLSTILGAAGIIGLAVGFAVRDTVENFIASIMLSIRQPFRPNDAVEINGDEGLVIRLTSRATILLSFDGNHIRIPNSTVFKSRILNYSRNRERRFLFEIGVSPNSDLAAVRHLAEKTVAELPFTLAEPAPNVWTDRIGDGAIFLTVTGWIDQREASLALAKGEAIRKVKAALEATGVEIPDTTYRIDIVGGAGALASTGTTPARSETKIEAEKEAAERAKQTDDVTITSADTALDKLVEEERADDNRPDLLQDDALEE